MTAARPEHFANEARDFTKDTGQELPIPAVAVGDRGGVWAAHGHVDKKKLLAAARIIDQEHGLSVDEVDDTVTTRDVQHRHALTIGDPGFGWWDLDLGPEVTEHTHGAVPVTVLDIRGRTKPPTR